ncbi:Cytochrome P450 [Streptomyces mirabilis]|uniref:Cytochrome P450 n=1 Tax=Streptomyces mirabilis TaxID=68239 RepID=A0A1I2X200_9ACTN|nr:Cytochrome P450 [Streptomyces mirabilis]
MTRTSTWQQILDPSHRADPYPLYAELRKTPVVRVKDGTYVVSTYREIVSLLHDPWLSSDARNLPEVGADVAAQYDEGLPGLPPNFIRTDPPEHDRIRRLLTRNFGPPHRPGRIDGMMSDLLGIVTRLIDDFTGEDGSGTVRVDIVDDFAYPFPVTVICELLGVPREDEPRFQVMSGAVIETADPTTGGIAERQRRRAKAVADLGQYFAQLLDARHGRRGDDLLSGLLSGDGDDAPMSHEEILSNAALLLVAGHETTVNLVTNGMLTLLRHPEVLDRLHRGDEPDLAAWSRNSCATNHRCSFCPVAATPSTTSRSPAPPFPRAHRSPSCSPPAAATPTSSRTPTASIPIASTTNTSASAAASTTASVPRWPVPRHRSLSPSWRTG